MYPLLNIETLNTKFISVRYENKR